jgi:hypothetical protein
VPTCPRGGEVSDGQRFVEVMERVLAHGREGVGIAVGARGGVLDELSLGSGAEGGGDHRAGDRRGRLGAVGRADQVQAQVDAGGRTGGGPDVAVLDEEGVGFDGDAGVVGAEQIDEVPVCDRAAAVEEAGLRECEGAAAQGGDGGAADVCAAQGFEYRFRCAGEMVVQAGDQDQVGTGQPGEGAVAGEAEAPAHGDGRGVGGDAVQVEGGDAAVGSIRAPDLGDDGDVEGPDAREADEGDTVRDGVDGHRGRKPSIADLCPSGAGSTGAAAW